MLKLSSFTEESMSVTAKKNPKLRSGNWKVWFCFAHGTFSSYIVSANSSGMKCCLLYYEGREDIKGEIKICKSH